jgi:hypothetical protein
VKRAALLHMVWTPNLSGEAVPGLGVTVNITNMRVPPVICRTCCMHNCGW